MPGTLFVVATPIGNLEDLTFRAARVLGEAAVVAAEDTRRTAILLQRHGIATPTLSYHEHNERERLPQLLARLAAGDIVALVTDAGTPGISDPGFRLVRAALDASLPVDVVPGASAVLTALVLSGLPLHRFVFEGFPPPRAVARRAWLRALAAEPRTIVFFEAPHRLRATLSDLAAIFGEREISVGRELTKFHQEVLRGPVGQVLARLKEPRGEVTVVVAGRPERITMVVTLPSDAGLYEEFCRLTENGHSRREAVAELARRHMAPARAIYASLERAKTSV